MTGKWQGSRRAFCAGTASAVALGLQSSPASAWGIADKQAIAQAAAGDRLLAAFYKDTGYETLWTGRSGADRARRRALLEVLAGAADHGLPTDRYPADKAEEALKLARSPEDRGKLDVALSKLFLRYADDVSTGILDPRNLPDPLNAEIGRRPLHLDLNAVLQGLRTGGNPKAFMAQLPPRSDEYQRLVAAKIEMQKIADTDGWGPEVRAARLEPGDSGSGVVALRNRLMRMGYLRNSLSAAYDDRLVEAVKRFQAANGLLADGICGGGTLAMLNTSPRTRLSQIVVALERERWTNFDKGPRYVEVNIPDFHARLYDGGREIFACRTIVGEAVDDHRTPEFSDQMEYLVFNPSWYVPKNIAIAEYLPMLQQDPTSLSHLDLLDANQNPVDRTKIDWSQVNENNWDYLLKEPPSQGNALGLVKFMFPNKFNIYLHDTPTKALFLKQTRDFSHGCIRLQDPFGLADQVLSPQVSDVPSFIKDALSHGEEYYVNLAKKLPVHLIYRTARAPVGGQVVFRGDIYGRDAAIFAELQRQGVVLHTA